MKVKIREIVRRRNQNIEDVNRMESEIVHLKRAIQSKEMAIKNTSYRKLCDRFNLNMYDIVKIVEA